MATFDQLPADQRAIIELVLRRGRSYDALADVLEIPPARVRELARDALAPLSPVTCDRVDADWRGQLADYLLGQQSGPESTATRGHLKRSEAARIWAFSVLDSLDTLYDNGSRPVIPDPDGRGRERDERPAPVAERPRERDAVAGRRRDRERAREADDGGSRGSTAEADRPARAAALEPEARRALRRRRGLAALGGVIVALAIAAAVLAATGSFSSSHKKQTAKKAPAAQILGEVPLAGTNGSGEQGLAVVAKRANQYELVVRASVKPFQQGYAYEVWLYNSPNDLTSLGAQVPDAQGTLQGAGQLPASYKRFQFIDITYQKISAGTGYNGSPVLRGSVANLQPVPAGAASTTTTPQP